MWDAVSLLGVRRKKRAGRSCAMTLFLNKVGLRLSLKAQGQEMANNGSFRRHLPPPGDNENLRFNFIIIFIIKVFGPRKVIALNCELVKIEVPGPHCPVFGFN